MGQIGQWIGRIGQRDWPVRATVLSELVELSGAPELPGEVPQVEPGHLVLQRAERDAQVARRRRHVPVRLLERAQDEVALERVARLLEQRVARRRRRVELREVVFERQVLVGDPFLVADRNEPLDQVLELADVAGPPVRRQDLQRRVRQSRCTGLRNFVL